MSLINCKECGKQISNTVKQCPNCGYKNKLEKGMEGLIFGIIFSVIAAFMVYSCTSSDEKTPNQSSTNLQNTTQPLTVSDKIKAALRTAVNGSHVSQSSNDYEVTFDQKTKLLTVICSKNSISGFSNVMTVESFISFYINLSEAIYKIDDIKYILVAQRAEFIDFYGHKVQGYNMIIRTSKNDFLAFNWEGFRHTGVPVFLQLKSASQKFYFHNQVLAGVNEKEIILE